VRYDAAEITPNISSASVTLSDGQFKWYKLVLTHSAYVDISVARTSGSGYLYVYLYGENEEGYDFEYPLVRVNDNGEKEYSGYYEYVGILQTGTYFIKLSSSAVISATGTIKVELDNLPLINLDTTYIFMGRGGEHKWFILDLANETTVLPRSSTNGYDIYNSFGELPYERYGGRTVEIILPAGRYYVWMRISSNYSEHFRIESAAPILIFGQATSVSVDADDWFEGQIFKLILEKETLVSFVLRYPSVSYEGVFHVKAGPNEYIANLFSRDNERITSAGLFPAGTHYVYISGGRHGSVDTVTVEIFDVKDIARDIQIGVTVQENVAAPETVVWYKLVITQPTTVWLNLNRNYANASNSIGVGIYDFKYDVYTRPHSSSQNYAYAYYLIRYSDSTAGGSVPGYRFAGTKSVQLEAGTYYFCVMANGSPFQISLSDLSW